MHAFRPHPRLVIPLLAVALVVAGCSRGPDDRFASEEVRRADVTERISAPGSVQPNASADVTAPSAGKLVTLQVRDGARVKRNQVVARISSPSVDDALRQAEAANTAANSAGGIPSLPTGQAVSAFDDLQAQVAAASASVLDALRAALPQLPEPARKKAAEAIDDAAERVKKSQAAASKAARAAADTVSATGSALTGALSSATAAQAATARTALEVAQEQQKRLTLRAPITGTVQLGRTTAGGASGGASLPDTSGLPAGADQLLQGLTGGGAGGGGGGAGSGPLLRAGSDVTAGQTIATILDVGTLTVAAEVDETDIALVKEGQKAEVELDAFPGVPFAADVLRVAIAPAGGASSGGTGGGVGYQVDLALGKPAADVQSDVPPAARVGMTATADIAVRSAGDALSVPSSALVGRGSGSAVYVIRDDKVKLTPVRLAASGEDRVAIRSGVSAGDRIVTKGAERLRDGQEYPGP
jgi:multidrug efflux pump subunit AcrA (membrane-fusion protein)